MTKKDTFLCANF